MTRIKQGYIARRRRTKIHLFLSSFRGAHSRLTRTVTQQKIRALVSAHRDRDRKKRAFRLLWITRINVVIRERGVSYSYNRLIHNLYKRQLLLNRKILSLSQRLLPRRSSHSSCPWEKWKELGGWSTLFPKK